MTLDLALQIAEQERDILMSYNNAADRKQRIVDVYCEGRKLKAWCGEFVSYVMMMAGAKDPAAINRVATAGKWRVGEDITTWSRYANREKIASRKVTGPGLYVMDAVGGGHIGLVRKVIDDQTFETIDGNSFKPIAINTRSLLTVRVLLFISAADLDSHLFNAAKGTTVYEIPPTPPTPDVPGPGGACGLLQRVHCASGAGKD